MPPGREERLALRRNVVPRLYLRVVTCVRSGNVSKARRVWGEHNIRLRPAQKVCPGDPAEQEGPESARDPGPVGRFTRLPAVFGTAAACSLALRVTAVAAEVAAGGVFELAVAFGALADEREVAAGPDAVGGADLYLRLLDRLLLVGEGARRVGLALEPAAREHDALGDGLLGGSQQPLVEPD